MRIRFLSISSFIATLFQKIFYHTFLSVLCYKFTLKHMPYFTHNERKKYLNRNIAFIFVFRLVFVNIFVCIHASERRKNFSNKNIYFFVHYFFFLRERRRDITTIRWCARASVSRKQGSEYKQHLRDRNVRKLISMFL